MQAMATTCLLQHNCSCPREIYLLTGSSGAQFIKSSVQTEVWGSRGEMRKEPSELEEKKMYKTMVKETASTTLRKWSLLIQLWSLAVVKVALGS